MPSFLCNDRLIRRRTIWKDLERPAFKIYNLPLMRLFVDNGFGKQFYFSAPARQIDHEMGDGHAGQVPMQTADEGQSLFYRNLKVCCPGHAIDLMQVVGTDPDLEQPFEKAAQHVGIVIDFSEQNGLASQGDAGIGH